MPVIPHRTSATEHQQMRTYPREFPSGRRKDPKRRAERRVYEALAGSDRRGFAYYEWRKGRQHPELDFAVWIADLGRVALQVKGGHYFLIDGDWHLKTHAGITPIRTSPLDEAWLAALDLRDDIEERACTPYNPYVVPVLMFPDMEPDPAIEHLACRKGVYLLWRSGALMDDLTEIVLSRGVRGALSWGRIAREVCAVTDGSVRLDGFAEAGVLKFDVERAGGGVPGNRATLRLMVNGSSVLVIRGRALSIEFGRRASTRRGPPG